MLKAGLKFGKFNWLKVKVVSLLPFLKCPKSLEKCQTGKCGNNTWNFGNSSRKYQGSFVSMEYGKPFNSELDGLSFYYSIPSGFVI